MKLKPFNHSNVLIAGPARNIAEHIGGDIKALFKAASGFREVHGLVIESDSTDNTLVILEQLKNTIKNFEYLALGQLTKKMPKRTERLAYARNLIVEQCKFNEKYKDIDFVMMVDLDGINRGITKEKIEHCWNDQYWDVVTANQPNAYYDIWTLRHPQWCPKDCFEGLRKLEKIVGEENAWRILISSKQISLAPILGMIEVDSAFGGLGIYKREAFITGQYKGLDANGNEVSDHINFHQDLKKSGYRIFINCELVNSDFHIDPKPLPPKKRTSYFLNTIKLLGISLFGKKRFHKYLNMIMNN